MNSLTEVGGNLSINSYGSVVNLLGLNNLHRVGGSFYLAGKTTGYSSLNALSVVNQELVIQNNTEITEINGFSNLDSVFHLNIQTNNNLVSITGFQNLHIVENSILISENPFLSYLFKKPPKTPPHF
ncbi:MAG: hypothetical protein IPN10_04725 [Saprospiraceae bacterium]|nr:hypothetical protein [Saprospiraceae bacterium]